MDEDSKLLADKGGVDVRIVGGLWMGKEAKITPRDDDAKAKDFTIAVAGSDPTVISKDTRLAPTTVVSIGREALYTACLQHLMGRFWMADEAGAKGAIAAFDIVVGEHVKVERESGFPVSSQGQQGSQQLHGYYGMPNVAPLVGPVAGDANISLAIGLPVRNPSGLKAFIKQVSDRITPTSAST